MGKTVSAYWVTGVCGYAAAILFIAFFTRNDRGRRENAIYIYTLGIVGALIGAKIVYIISVLPQFISDLDLVFSDIRLFFARYFMGGLVFYGGLGGAVAAAAITARSYRVSFSDYFDILVPAVIISAGFGRIGCFLAGCCYGKVTDSPVGIAFVHSVTGVGNVPRIPTQLFEMIFDFIMLAVILVLIHRGLKGAPVLLIYLGTYCVFRFILEFFRGDAVRGHLWLLSTSQWISIMVMAAVIWTAVWYTGRDSSVSCIKNH